MPKLKFTEEELSKFQTLDDLEKEIFTPEQIKDIHDRAEKRSKARQNLSDEVSKAVIEYMAANHLGFNQFKKQLNISSASLSKILKGQANLTLGTIAEISEATGLQVHISFQRPS